MMGAFKAAVGLAGGLGLFVFGMQMCSEGLQKVAAKRLKRLVRVLTANPVVGLTVGTIITLGLQSSSATSALVVGFVSAGMMTLSQALGVLLGTAIGASLTVQLIAFKTADLALVMLFAGSILFLFSHRTRRRSLGQAVLGFGLIFYGMFVMSAAMAPVREYPAVVRALVRIERYPLAEFFMAMIITAVIQSSPAFLALLMTLATQGLVGPLAVIPFVLGAHLGGTVAGVVSSLGTSGRDAKRAAWANFALKLLNGLLFLPLYKPLAGLMLWSSADIGRQVANAHTFFSIAMALGFLPLTSVMERLMGRVIPGKSAGPGEAIFLDQSLLDVPELAVHQAHRQTVEMGHLVKEQMLDNFIPALQYGNDEVIDRIGRTESAVDSLYKQISRFVTSLGGGSLPDDLMQRSVQVLYAANDLEHIGDVLMNVVQIARKIHSEELELSAEGFEEIEAMYRRAYGNLDLALRAFETMDQALAGKVIKEHPKMLRLEKLLRYSHFDRMQSGNEKSALTSPVHLDLIEDILRIDGHAVNIAQVVMGIV